MVITVLIKSIFWIITISSVLFLIYSFMSLHGKAPVDEKLPLPYRAIYNKVRKIPLVNLEVERYKNDLSLIKGSTFYGELAVSIYCGAVPAIAIVIVMVVLNYVSIWYWAFIICFCGIIIPYLALANSISKKAHKLKMQNIRYYQAAERYYSNGTQTSETFSQLKSTSTGSLRRVHTNFVNTYFTEPNKAYDEYVQTINDKYAKGFIKSVMAFDEKGEDPCQEINSIVKTATTQYKLIEASVTTISQARIIAVIVLCASVGFGFMSNKLAYTMGAESSGVWMTYAGIVLSLGIIILSQIFEKNSEG